MRAHQYSSDQKEISNDQSAQTTARVASVAYRLRLPFLINRVLKVKERKTTKKAVTTNMTGPQKMYRGVCRDFENRVALYVGHHGWPRKKMLGFRWSKKANTTLETISFWQIIFISIFRFSPFLYTMKACQ